MTACYTVLASQIVTCNFYLCYLPKGIIHHRGKGSTLPRNPPTKVFVAYHLTYQPPPQSPFSPTNAQDYLKPSPMSVHNLPSVSSMYQPTMFNYERPKHFLQSKSMYQGKQQPPGPETSTSPSRPIKQSSILIQPHNPSGQKFASSPSLSSSFSLSSPSYSAPKESAQSPASSSSGQRLSTMHNQSPAAFLCSVLPSQSVHNSQAPPPTEPK